MKMFHMFRVPDYLTLAAQELDESQRQLLKAETAKAYAECMVNYHSQTIKRLEKLLAGNNRDKSVQSVPAKEDTMP